MVTLIQSQLNRGEPTGVHVALQENKPICGAIVALHNQNNLNIALFCPTCPNCWNVAAVMGISDLIAHEYGLW